jgi:hypothetical protein
LYKYINKMGQDLSKLVGYTTQDDLKKYALKKDIPTDVDLTSYVKKEELPPVQDLSPYAKKAELPPVQDLSPYAKKAELPPVQDLSPYAKKAELPPVQDLSPYAKKAELPDHNQYAKSAVWNADGSITIGGDKRVLIGEDSTNIKNRFIADQGIEVPTGKRITIRDANHGMVYASDMDGPQLYGVGGGKLTAKGKDILKWKPTGINITGDLIINDKNINTLLSGKVDNSRLDDLVSTKALSGDITINSLSTNGNITMKGSDFVLGKGNNARGDTGPSRALVKGDGGQLVVNYGNDFKGGVKIDSDLKVNGKIKNRGFVGPYQMRFYGHDNKCADVGQNNGFGILKCDDTNKNQQFYTNSNTGQILNAENNKCLDTNGGNKWAWIACNDGQNQQFWRKEHLLQWKNGRCLDIGNADRSWTCDGNNKNQSFSMKYLP